MAKYYTLKLTEAQYNHVLSAMNYYGYDVLNDYDVLDNPEQDNDKRQLRLHERTEQALMKAGEK